jgi:hypothetical protein
LLRKIEKEVEKEWKSTHLFSQKES